MFSSHLNEESSWAPILTHPVLASSLAWLKRNAMSSDFGNYDFGSLGWFANVHGYQTLPEAECCWENHKHTVDIQCLISGSEQIRWVSVDELGAARCYMIEKDRQEFDMPDMPVSIIVMRPGMFAVFLPGEAHCPKIAVEEEEVIKKVVVKIPIYLLRKRND